MKQKEFEILEPEKEEAVDRLFLKIRGDILPFIISELEGALVLIEQSGNPKSTEVLVKYSGIFFISTPNNYYTNCRISL